MVSELFGLFYKNLMDELFAMFCYGRYLLCFVVATSSYCIVSTSNKWWRNFFYLDMKLLGKLAKESYASILKILNWIFSWQQPMKNWTLEWIQDGFGPHIINSQYLGIVFLAPACNSPSLSFRQKIMYIWTLWFDIDVVSTICIGGTKIPIICLSKPRLGFIFIE